MFTNSIRKQVMVAIDEKISQEQEKYDVQCDAIDREAEVKKVEAKENAVQSIIGKIL